MAAELCQMEIDVLRVLNGEDVEGMVAGAAMWACATFLKKQGLATGHYEITDAGREYLARLDKGEQP